MKRTGAIRCAAVLMTGLASVAVVFAAELTSAPLDLKYKSLDLIYRVQDLGAPAVPTGQNKKAMTGDGSALRGEVSDLKNAGAEVKESDTEIKISLQGEILFDFDKADLRPEAETTLAQIAALIKKYPKPGVLIEGHTDGKGSEVYNAKLSARRAASVKTWLVAHGVAERAIRTQGLGASKPVAPNKKPDGSDNPEGRQKNRRVEITIKK